MYTVGYPQILQVYAVIFHRGRLNPMGFCLRKDEHSAMVAIVETYSSDKCTVDAVLAIVLAITTLLGQETILVVQKNGYTHTADTVLSTELGWLSVCPSA
jgi:hypothetical protein